MWNFLRAVELRCREFERLAEGIHSETYFALMARRDVCGCSQQAAFARASLSYSQS